MLCCIHSIGIDKAAKIAYAALMNFAESNETFMKSRQHWKAAATKLYGECSNEWIETCNAWAAVKVGTSCGPCLTYTPCYRCKSEIVQPLGVKDYSDITNKLGSIRIYMNPTDGIIQVDLPEFTNGDFELAPPNYLIFCSNSHVSILLFTSVSLKKFKQTVRACSQLALAKLTS